MAPNSSSRSNPTLRIVLVLMVLLLLGGGAVGLFVWLDSQPKMLSAGHRWALYPSTGSNAADGDSSQQTLAYAGNVKLMTVLYEEEMSKGQGMQVREVLCHVLIELPPEGVLRVAGSGSGAMGEVDRRVKFHTRGQRDNTEPEKELELRFDPKQRVLVLLERIIERQVNDQYVTLVPVDQTQHGPLSTASSNIFLVRLDENFDVVEVVPLNETISTRLDDGAVSSLIEKAGAED